MSLATTDNHVFTRGLIAAVGTALQEGTSIGEAIYSTATLVFDKASICSMVVMLTRPDDTPETYRCDAGPLTEPLEAIVTHQLQLVSEEVYGENHSVAKMITVPRPGAEDEIANVKGLLSVPLSIDSEHNGQLLVITEDHTLYDASELHGLSCIADLLGHAISKQRTASNTALESSDPTGVAPILYFRIEHVAAIEAVFGRESVDMLFSDIIQRIERTPCLSVIARVQDSGIAIVLSDHVVSTKNLSNLCLKACSDLVIQDKVRVQVTAQSGLEPRTANAFIAPEQPRTIPLKQTVTA